MKREARELAKARKRAKVEEELALIDLWMRAKTVEEFLVNAEARFPDTPRWKLALFRLYGFIKRHQRWNLPFTLAGYAAIVGVMLSFGLYSTSKDMAAAMLVSIPVYVFLRTAVQIVSGALLLDRVKMCEEGRYYKIKVSP